MIEVLSRKISACCLMGLRCSHVSWEDRAVPVSVPTELPVIRYRFGTPGATAS
jgi:hypothetical protein